MNKTPNLPEVTKSFEKLDGAEQNLWTALHSLKEGETAEGKPEGDSNGEQFCAMAFEYLTLKKHIEDLEKAKKLIRDFLVGRLVSRGLGVVNCDTARVTLSALTKEVMDKEYLKEACPDAFARVPDTLRLDVTEAK